MCSSDLNTSLEEIKLKQENYNTKDYYDATKTNDEKYLQTEAERGVRCKRCYEFRMKKTYEYAVKNNFDFFTTTLSISPHKDADTINEIGKKLSEANNNNKITLPGNQENNDYYRTVVYLYADFKKNNGYLRSLELSKKYNLYRQDYCGCIFSKQNKPDGKGEK